MFLDKKCAGKKIDHKIFEFASNSYQSVALFKNFIFRVAPHVDCGEVENFHFGCNAVLYVT